MQLEKDHDPKTGEYLEEPDYLLPNYEVTKEVKLHIISDHLFDLPHTYIAPKNLNYLATTRASIFTVQMLTMFERLDPLSNNEADEYPELKNLIE